MFARPGLHEPRVKRTRTSRLPRRVVTGLAIALLAGCASNSGLELSVDVRTDLVPGRNFIGVRVEHFNADRSRTLNRADAIATLSQDYFEGYRVADFEDVPGGPQLLLVSLISPDGDVVASRLTSLDLNSSYAVTVVLTASCSGIECPGEGDDPTYSACHGGQCVDPRCSVEEPEFCGPQNCTTDDECSSPVPCGVPICRVGVCFVRLDDSACLDGEVCDVEGCIPDPAVVMMDAGMDDGGPDCPASETLCSDGRDDDCDGLTDCEDPDCESESCDDGNLCTTADACGDAGTCVGTPVVCDDENACTDDACDPETGGCESVNNTASCDDGLWCNGADSCAGGACTEHSDPPCPTFCNETSMACEACRGPDDCGTVTFGGWGSCGGYADSCDETGTQSRTVTTPTCTAGMCGTVVTMESQGCMRDTDGVTCGSTTMGGWSGCSGYTSTCDETGNRTRTITMRQCAAGSCANMDSVENGSCGRDTDGTSCGTTTYGAWGSCGGYSNACDETGSRSRTCTARSCVAGSCASQNTTQNGSCGRTVNDGTVCGGSAWQVCCGPSCVDTRNNNAACGSCGQACAGGLTCAATGNGGYGCRSCTANSQCTGSLDSDATCWNVAAPPAYCQCQCPGAGHQICADAGCGPGMYCHDCSGHNWCAPFPGSC